MEADIESRKNSDRSPRFPFINLEKALDRAGQFYAQEKRGTAPYAAAAKHWGYSPSSSGALQTVAALKSYGLLEGAKDNLRLTELAQHILLDKRPDSTERDTYKRQAALSPDVAARVYAQWPDDLPSEATLNHYLVLNLGFSEQTSAKSVEIIKQNHIFTANGQSFIPAVQSRNDEIMPNIEYMKEVKDVGVTSNSQKTPFRLTTKSWFEQTTDPNGLNISLQFEDQPTKETYEYLVAFFTFKSTQIKKTPSDG